MRVVRDGARFGEFNIVAFENALTKNGLSVFKMRVHHLNARRRVGPQAMP